MQQGRIRQPNRSQQAHCKIFGNCTRGSDPNRVWNTTERKYALETLLKGVFQKEAAEQPRHLNRNKTQEIHYNSLKHFLLRGFIKHPPWFRCSGKWEHLNLAKRQNQAAKPLTTSTLQDIRQLHSWFRSQPGLEHHRTQIRPRDTSERGIPEMDIRITTASEPEQNSKNPPQLIDKLPITRIKQVHFLVQMQRKKKHLTPAERQNPAFNSLTTNALQDFRKLHLWFRSQPVLEHRRMQMRPEGVSGRGIRQRATEQHMHLNRDKTQKIHCNTLINFSLHGLSKHLLWFRCSGKGEHLNPAERQNPADNPLTTNALQDFQRLHPWFRSQPVLEHRRTQMRPGGASGRDIH